MHEEQSNTTAVSIVQDRCIVRLVRLFHGFVVRAMIIGYVGMLVG